MLEITKHLESHSYRSLKKDSEYNQIPSISDGLKPIERTILSIIIKLSIENKNNYILSKNIILKSMEILDFDVETLYKVICIMVNNKKILFETKGNFGCLDYPEYQKESDYDCTSIKLSSFLYDYYKLNNVVKKYIPFIVPIGLIGNNISSKVGKNQFISPKYKLSDLLIRLKGLLNDIETLPIIKPNIEGCLISEVNNGFKDILETYSGTVNVSPKNKNDDKSITLFGSVPIRKFNKLLSETKNEETSTKHKLFTYKTTVDPFSLTLYPNDNNIKGFASKINRLVSESIKFNNIVADIDENFNNTKIRQISIDDILKSSFNIYKKYKISQLENKINQLSVIIKQINIGGLILSNISSVSDSNFINIINKENKYSQDDIKTVLNLISINNLLVMPKISDKEKELKNLQNQLKNIDELIKNELDTFISISNKDGL